MDLLFYIYASIGVILFGISKGGFAGPVAILSIPIMALVMNPINNDYWVAVAVVVVAVVVVGVM